MENQIIYLEVTSIFPHKNNPRKDLGDLTELAASIKANGIMQNLTVVRQETGYCTSCNLYNPGVGKCTEDHDKNEKPPCSKWESGEKYTVIIGHRRLAAAKKAGLAEVPCVIAEDMDERQQIATMLLENMQRSDLTVLEQAEGFQMMMDFGETIDDISKKTGFSESTVRHRVKMLELDPDKLKKAAGRGGTLQDFVELEKIKDPSLKDKVLDAVGTANFNYELARAKTSEKNAILRDILITDLKTFATEIGKGEGNKFKCVKCINVTGYKKNDMEKPEDAGKSKYYFIDYDTCFYLYAEKSKADKAASQPRVSPADAPRKEREKKLDEIAERLYMLRFEFIKGLTGLKKKAKTITAMAAASMYRSEDTYVEFDTDIFCDLMDLDSAQAKKDDFDFADFISDANEASPERVLLMASYTNFEDNSNENYHGWNGEYEENENLDLIYGYLEQLGYEMSDEEKTYCDGTHELYVNENGND